MSTAVASAYNDWQIEHWLSKDRVFVVLLSLLLKTLLKQHVKSIASEVTRKWFKLALSIRCPYGGWGDKRYQPIWEATVRNGFVCTFHVSVLADYLNAGPVQQTIS